MIIAGLVLAGLAALLHGYIFYLESLAWTTPRAQRIFGTTDEQAAMTRELAFNQGFYNLFLGIEVIVGLIVFVSGATFVGAALVLAGTGSMALAALVLFVSSPDKRSAALRQGVLPLLSVLALGVGFAI